MSASNTLPVSLVFLAGIQPKYYTCVGLIWVNVGTRQEDKYGSSLLLSRIMPVVSPNMAADFSRLLLLMFYEHHAYPKAMFPNVLQL